MVETTMAQSLEIELGLKWGWWMEQRTVLKPVWRMVQMMEVSLEIRMESRKEMTMARSLVREYRPTKD